MNDPYRCGLRFTVVPVEMVRHTRFRRQQTTVLQGFGCVPEFARDELHHVPWEHFIAAGYTFSIS